MINLEFDSQLIRWIYHYLKGRTTFVQVDNCLSAMKPLNRGLPQRAVLSPKLLNIVLSDLPKSPQVKILSYADDIILVAVSNSVGATQQRMQDYLHLLSHWLKN
jgi:hypothetical protein